MKRQDLERMSTEELKSLKSLICEILAEREARKSKKVLVEHPCKGSSKYHMNKYHHWMKRVTDIDTSKTNGYAFKGEFLSVYKEHLLPINSIVVYCCGTKVTLATVKEEGLETVIETEKNSLYELIQKAKELLG